MNPDELVQHALLLAEAGRTTDALALVGRVLSADPDHAMALQVAGLLLLRTNQPDRAVEHARRAAALGGDDEAVFLMTVLEGVGKVDEATELALRLVPVVGGDATHLTTVAHTLLARDPALARTLARRAHGLVPDPDSLLVIAEIYATEDDPALRSAALDEAERIAQDRLAWDPECVAAHELLVDLSGDRGDFATAMSRASQAAKVSPQDMAFLPVQTMLLVGGLTSVATGVLAVVALWIGLRWSWRDPAVPWVLFGALFVCIAAWAVFTVAKIGLRQFRRALRGTIRKDPMLAVLPLAVMPMPWVLSHVVTALSPWSLGVLVMLVSLLVLPVPDWGRRVATILDSPVVLVAFCARRLAITAGSLTVALSLLLTPGEEVSLWVVIALATAYVLVSSGWPLFFYRRRLDRATMREATGTVPSLRWQVVAAVACVLFAAVSPLVFPVFRTVALAVIVYLVVAFTRAVTRASIST